MVATGWTEIARKAKKLTKSTPFKNVRGITFNPAKKVCIIQSRGTKPKSKRITRIIKCSEADSHDVDLVQSFSDGTTMMDFEKPTLCGYSKVFDSVHCPPLRK